MSLDDAREIVRCFTAPYRTVTRVASGTDAQPQGVHLRE